LIKANVAKQTKRGLEIQKRTKEDERRSADPIYTVELYDEKERRRKRVKQNMILHLLCSASIFFASVCPPFLNRPRDATASFAHLRKENGKGEDSKRKGSTALASRKCNDSYRFRPVCLSYPTDQHKQVETVGIYTEPNF